mmetsp:Transcript_9805/g.36423  ORF Transcript_9805/g.36423 Transcript_9805/m.36423 type:complete len:470 (+) Transcript_9805:3547-4956(+)
MGSAALVMARARRFSSFAASSEPPSPAPGAAPAPSDSDAPSSSSAGSGGTVPSSRRLSWPVAACHVVGTNVASGGSPPRHTGAAHPASETREGGAHSAQSSHHVAPLALATVCSDAAPALLVVFNTFALNVFDPRVWTPAAARSAAPTPPAPQSAPPAKLESAPAAAAAAGRWSSSRHRRSMSTASWSTVQCSHTSCHATPVGRGGGRDRGSDGAPNPPYAPAIPTLRRRRTGDVKPPGALALASPARPFSFVKPAGGPEEDTGPAPLPFVLTVPPHRFALARTFPSRFKPATLCTGTLDRAKSSASAIVYPGLCGFAPSKPARSGSRSTALPKRLATLCASLRSSTSRGEPARVYRTAAVSTGAGGGGVRVKVVAEGNGSVPRGEETPCVLFTFLDPPLAESEPVFTSCLLCVADNAVLTTPNDPAPTPGPEKGFPPSPRFEPEPEFSPEFSPVSAFPVPSRTRAPRF